MLPWLFLPTSTPAAVTLDSVLAQLRRPPPVSEAFHDVRYRRALKAPLVSAGTLIWNGGFEFERSVTSPYRETGRVSGRTLTVRRGRGGERVIPLARAPELQVLFAGLAALFAGDGAAIERDFEITLTGDSDWRLRLVPRDQRLREHVPALEMLGDASGARCLLIVQGDARTLTILGSTETPVPTGDFDVTVGKYCPTP